MSTNRQGVHQLPLVLVGPLHLDVKHKVGIQVNLFPLLYHSGQLLLLACLI